MLESIREVRKVAWILLSNASIESVEGNVLTLAFEREGDAKGFASSGCDQDLADVLDRMFGVRPVIRSGVGSAPGRGGNSGGDRARSDAGRSDDASARERPSQRRRGQSRQLGPVLAGRAPPDDGWPDGDGGAVSRPATAPARSEPARLPPSARPTTTRPDDPAGPPGGRSHAKANGAPARTRNPSGRRRRARPCTTTRGSRPTRTHPAATDLSGSDLIMRELGGQVIEEIGEG